MQNPYLVADSRQAAREYTAIARLATVCLPGVAATVAMVLAGPEAFPWAQASGSYFASAGAGHAARVGVALAGAMALLAYDAGVRGPDRGLVDIHPVLAAPYLHARRRRVAVAGVPWLVGALPLLFPLGRDIAFLVPAALLVVGGWAAGQACGLAFALRAPSAALSPSVAPLLDAVRGANPRPQAALIWAPGAALALAGSAVVAGAYGLAAGGGATLAIALPFTCYRLVSRWVRPSARDLCAIPAVVNEVDAAWASVDAAEEGARVYLEGPVRWLPRAWRPEVLRHLRHAWREHRGYLGATWALVAVATVAVLSRDDLAAPSLVLCLATLGALGPRLAAADPRWLDLALPRPGIVRGRAVALGLYMAAAGCAPAVLSLLTGQWPVAAMALACGPVLAQGGARLRTPAFLVLAVSLVAVSSAQ